MEPLFFKPIIALDQLVKIPVTFINKHLKEEDLTYALLQDREGSLCLVKIEEDRSFGEGWQEFARDHNLKVGNFLIFCHMGSMVFTVDVRDRTTCEREDSPVYARDTIIIDEEESTQPHNVPSSGEMPEESTQAQNVPYSSGETSSEYSNDEQWYRSFTRTLESSYANSNVLHFPAVFVKTNQLEKRSNAEVILVDPLGKEFRGIKLAYANAHNQVSIRCGWRSYSITQDLQEGASVTFELIQNTEEVVKFQLYHDVPSNGMQSKKKFKGIELEHRKLIFVLTSSNIRHCLTISKEFAERNGLARRGGKMVLKDGKGKSWEVFLTNDARTASIGRGWLKFVRDNKLEVGHIFGLQLVSNGSKPIMKFKVLGKC